MNTEAPVRTAVCIGYERLLQECQAACQIWNGRRAEVRDHGLLGKRVDDDLRRLQAKYAKAYSVLRNHVHNCETCQWASSLGDNPAARPAQQGNFSHVA